MSGPSDYFLIIGAAAMLVGFLLFWRMTVEVNAVLPGRVSLAVRKDWSEAGRLHPELLPNQHNPNRLLRHGSRGVAGIHNRDYSKSDVEVAEIAIRDSSVRKS